MLSFFAFSYDSVDKALLAGEHVVGGVKLILTKEPADYWVRTNDMPLRMTVHELCGLVGNQPSSRILPGDVILHLDNGEAVIKNQNRQTMNEPRARSLANMWTISAVMAGCPLRFEAIRAQTSKNQLCVNFQNGRCQYTHTMCHWAHIDCPLQRNCREEQCGLGHPPERNIRGRIILNQGMFQIVCHSR